MSQVKKSRKQEKPAKSAKPEPVKEAPKKRQAKEAAKVVAKEEVKRAVKAKSQNASKSSQVKNSQAKEESKRKPRKQEKPASEGKIPLSLPDSEVEYEGLLPKKHQSAYNFFMVEETDRLKKAQGISHKEAFRLCGPNWTALDAKARQKYEQLAAEDKKRYEQQLNSIHEVGYFLDEAGVKSTDVKVDDKGQRLKEKFPGYEGVEPKKPTSAYFFFQLGKSAELRKAGKSLTEATKEAGAIWNKMGEIEKEPFAKQAEADHERYNRQVAEIVSQGFFLLPDGKTRSCDVEKKIKKKRRPAGESPSRKSAKAAKSK